MPTENGVHVLVRVCPAQNPEVDCDRLPFLVVDEVNGNVEVDRTQNRKGLSDFKFSAVLGPTATQQDVYSKCQNIIGSDMTEGISCCIMAYGQTSSG